MDALHELLNRVDRLSVLDTALLLAVCLLVGERVKGILGNLKCARERISRIERNLREAGWDLGDIEEE